MLQCNELCHLVDAGAIGVILRWFHLYMLHRHAPSCSMMNTVPDDDTVFNTQFVQYIERIVSIPIPRKIL